MITSRRNETLKAIRRLRRRQGEHALLEGPHLVREALDSGLPLSSVLITAEFRRQAGAASLLDRLEKDPLEVEAALLDELADADSPRGILAVTRLPRLRDVDLPLVEDGTYLLLDGIQEPGNLGAISRAAEAFGVTALALAAGTVHPNHPRALRASAGSLLRLPVAREVDLHAVADRLRPIAPLWAGLAAHGGEPLPTQRPAGALVLACGSEAAGLSARVVERLRLTWTIPLLGRAESLNAAVAVGVALFALRRAQDQPG